MKDATEIWCTFCSSVSGLSKLVCLSTLKGTVYNFYTEYVNVVY